MKLKPRESALVLGTAATVFMAMSLLVFYFRRSLPDSDSLWHLPYALPIGFGSLLFVVLLFHFGKSANLLTVPSGLSSRVYIVHGVRVAVLYSALLVSFGGVLAFLCLFVPARLVYIFLYEYVVHPEADPYFMLLSALAGFPVAIICFGGIFALAFDHALISGKGKIRYDQKVYLDATPTQGFFTLPDLLYLSWTSLLGASCAYEATGWCRWIALVASLVGKMLEAIIIAIALGIVVNRLASYPQQTQQAPPAIEAPAVIPPAP